MASAPNALARSLISFADHKRVDKKSISKQTTTKTNANAMATTTTIFSLSLSHFCFWVPHMNWQYGICSWWVCFGVGMVVVDVVVTAVVVGCWLDCHNFFVPFFLIHNSHSNTLIRRKAFSCPNSSTFFSSSFSFSSFSLLLQFTTKSKLDSWKLTKWQSRVYGIPIRMGGRRATKHTHMHTDCLFVCLCVCLCARGQWTFQTRISAWVLRIGMWGWHSSFISSKMVWDISEFAVAPKNFNRFNRWISALLSPIKHKGD